MHQLWYTLIYSVLSIVPILPDYLAKINNGTVTPPLPSIAGKNEGLHLVTGILTKPPRIPGNSSINFTVESASLPKETYTDDILEGENASIGLLLAMKALVQLIFNPIVGNYSAKIGYRIPIVVGTASLLVSSLGMFDLSVVFRLYPFSSF